MISTISILSALTDRIYIRSAGDKDAGWRILSWISTRCRHQMAYMFVIVYIGMWYDDSVAPFRARGVAV